MTTQQLIEMSVLDALALLDDEERKDFERSFVSASPGVQAHVRREQTRLCNIDAILPDVEPPAGLRAAVLAAVRDEIEIEAHTVQRAPFLLTAKRVSPLWRAATVGLATAAVVLGGTVVYINQQIGDINRQIENLGTADMVQSSLGRDFAAAAADPASPKFAFQPVSADAVGTAVVFINPETNVMFLDCEQLPMQDDRSYTLVLVDGNGDETVLAKFTSDGGTEIERITGEFTLTAASSLVIFGSNDQGQFEPMFSTPEGAFSRL